MSDFVYPDSRATGDTHCTAEQYDALYQQSLNDPDGFWADGTGEAH